MLVRKPSVAGWLQMPILQTPCRPRARKAKASNPMLRQHRDQTQAQPFGPKALAALVIVGHHIRRHGGLDMEEGE